MTKEIDVVNQSCKFASGDLVFESHGPELMSVYVAFGSSLCLHTNGALTVVERCPPGSEFFFYFGSMDRWGHDKNHKSGEGSQVCSLPSLSVHLWDTDMKECYSGSLGPKPSDSSYTKWAWRVALWRHWCLSPGSLEHLSPICKATLGDTEFSMLIDKFTAHFWIWPNCTNKN